jgi:hypothetical protein
VVVGGDDHVDFTTRGPSDKTRPAVATQVISDVIKDDFGARMCGGESENRERSSSGQRGIARETNRSLGGREGLMGLYKSLRFRKHLLADRGQMHPAVLATADEWATADRVFESLDQVMD